MLRRLTRFVILLLISALANSTVVQDIVVSIRESGASKTLQRLYRNHDKWDEFLSRVANGDRESLVVAIQLYEVSDGGSAEQIELAAGEALEHQPRVVFEIAGPVIGIEAICGGPDVDDERYDSYERSMAAIERRIGMVSAVADPRFASARDQCVHELQTSKSGIARFFAT